MEKVIKYALDVAMDVVMKKDYITGARRAVNTAEGRKWLKDCIAIQTEVAEMLADEMGIDSDAVKFLCTGGQCTIFLQGNQYNFVTPYSYKKATENLKPVYEGAA